MAEIGQIIDGKFQIRSLIDKGGMARVYLADDLRLGKQWVVKEIIDVENGTAKSLMARSALNEAHIIQSLDHPAIVRIVDIIKERNTIYIVEDYVAGTSLREVCEQDEVSQNLLISWGMQLCEVLIYLHGQSPPVIYRDLKPENIILTPGGHLRLIDFGIARRYKSDRSTDTEYLGTAGYAAPEQYAQFHSQSDERTDIYGLGQTLKELASHCPEPAPYLYEIIEKCTQERPENRYQSAYEILNDLRQVSRKKKIHNNNNRISLIRILLAVIAVICLFMAAVAIGLRHNAQIADDMLIPDFLDEIETDEHFTTQEEEQLLELLSQRLSKLKEKEGFEQIAFRIGKLYWYFYDYGVDHTAGIIASGSWFELAGDYEGTAQIYRQFSKLQSERRDLTDSDAYYAYFEQLSYLADFIVTRELSDALYYEFSEMIISDVGNMMWEFYQNKVETERILQLLNILNEGNTYHGGDEKQNNELEEMINTVWHVYTEQQ